MANYIGVHCPVCDKRFSEGDDIVVCPTCGAPHHRSCYQQLGHCALDELHIKGHTWEPPSQSPPSGGSSDEAACPACGAMNPSTGLFCQSCGGPLGSSSAAHPTAQTPFSGTCQPHSDCYAAALGGLSPDETIDGVSVREIALYIGPASQYFLPRFKQLSERGGLSINLSAFFFNFFYFFYRKMYLAGAAMVGLFLLGIAPTFFLFPEFIQYVLDNMEDIMLGINVVFEPTQNLWVFQVLPFTRVFLVICGAVFSIFANRIYLHTVLRGVRKLKKCYTAPDGQVDEQRYCQALSCCGGTSMLTPVLCGIGLMGGIYLFSILLTSLLMGV